MQSAIDARYLNIEWQEPGRARGIEIAAEPIDIECASDGAMTVETQMFHDMHPWLGLRLSGVLARAKPAFISAQGKRHPMLAVDDGRGGVWWVQNDGWDAERKRHLSELHRTMARFEIAIGSQRLFVENVATGLGRAQIEEYLRDFKQDLIWLVMGFGTATATGGGPPVDTELVSALTAFTSAARRVNENPALSLREITAETRIARLRPNAATFRQYARMPAAQRLVGRGTEETADIADNRYLRHMVQVCERLARNVAQSAQRQTASFMARADMEAKRSAEYRAMDSRVVDPEIFDRQIAELGEKLDRVASYSDGDHSDQSTADRVFPMSINKPFLDTTNRFFYNKANWNSEEDRIYNIEYSVVQLPEKLAKSIRSIRFFCRNYVIRGVATLTRKQNAKNKDYRLLSFNHVVSVNPDRQALIKKEDKREELEQNGWIARLSPKEREETRQEGRTAELRSEVFLKRAQRAAEAAKGLMRSQLELHRQDLLWDGMDVGSSPLIPMGMRFSQSPDYAACLSAFCRVRELAEPSGIGDAALGAIDRIGILHASALYERWCLVKVISVLMEDFRFVPEAGWQDHLIRAVTGLPESLVLSFHRDDIQIVASLEIQPLLPNGRRPDLRLRFGRKQSSAGEVGIVMDAKFRNEWRRGELASVLDELVSAKGYGQEGDRVFILQPAARTATRATSPLPWGRDCDYGQDQGTNHRRGIIHLAPGEGVANPVAHLRRLIALQLQASFPIPQKAKPDSGQWESDSFCIRCGKVHGSGDTRHRLTQVARKDFWELRCASCEMLTTRTHCYGCGQTLFKNGSYLTYHRTLADQITNVACPNCGEYFDPDLRDDSDAFQQP